MRKLGRACAQLVMFASVLIAAWSIPARAGILLERWVTTPGGTPDGMALGDVDGDGRLEIALITAWNHTDDSQPGRSRLHAVTIRLGRFQVQPARISRLSRVRRFDGDRFAEVAFSGDSDDGILRLHGDAPFSAHLSVLLPGDDERWAERADINNDGYYDLS